MRLGVKAIPLEDSASLQIDQLILYELDGQVKPFVIPNVGMKTMQANKKVMAAMMISGDHRNNEQTIKIS